MDKKRFIIVLAFIICFVISITLSSLYYKDKYTVSFETGTNEIILTKYVNKNDTIVEPSSPVKDGFVFKEWQLNGKKYNFDEKIKEDMVLTAKWIKEEYISINFNTNSDYVIDSKKILKGNGIDELPISEKEGYEFIGWFLDGQLYNNEEIYDDIELKAEYKNNTINTIYKVGDKVSITGNYSDSAYSDFPYNKIAIGWQRKILNIIDNSEYPYVVGNETGVTGFFKASSIERME